ncbi:hypothetical protein G5B46_08410 [Caulobacter sp. 602-2]|uniref:Uncharacterized protein n=1 Tax=Caulobacter sp. 602-2 TaxID=2710887 RepID=A0A6G4QWK8_9CAUL|nr:hypothetical protein [Caulobacter sp. 602-2]NGM49625.1 hypothetical protein [Caulobacter sp. 602-2]
MTPGEGSALDLAARRLERAVANLEQKIAAERAERAQAAAQPAAGDLFAAAPAAADAAVVEKAAQLAADLEAARVRERALEEAGEQASEALGRAIAEIRAALGDESLIGEGVHDDEEEGAAPADFADEAEDDPEALYDEDDPPFDPDPPAKA